MLSTRQRLPWTFSAARGHGAYRNGERLSVSPCDAIERALLVTGFPYDRKTARENNFAQFLRSSEGPKGFAGSARRRSICRWLLPAVSMDTGK